MVYNHRKWRHIHVPHAARQKTAFFNKLLSPDEWSETVAQAIDEGIFSKRNMLRAGALLLAYLVLPFAVGGALLGATFVAEMAANALTHSQLSVLTAAGGTLLLSVVDRVPKLFTVLLGFVAGPTARAFATIVAVAFGLGFELALVAETLDRRDDNPTADVFIQIPFESPEREPELIYFHVDTPPEGAPLSLLVTYTEEATREALELGKGPGVTLSDSVRDRIRSILDDVTECRADDPAPHVRLDVVGYASSSDWHGEDPHTSDAMNLRLANVRAASLASFINEHYGKYVVANAIAWPSVEAMDPGVVDRTSTGEYDKGRGRLNRRVQIRLTYLADCQSAPRISVATRSAD